MWDMKKEKHDTNEREWTKIRLSFLRYVLDYLEINEKENLFLPFVLCRPNRSPPK